MAYTANPVRFDGSSDVLINGADLSGSADTKLWTGSVWTRRISIGVEHNIAFGVGIAYQVRFTGGNVFHVFGENAAGSTILSITSTNTITNTAWHHFLWSVDMTDVAKSRIYIDDVAETTIVLIAFTNDIIDFTITDHSIGGRTNAANKINAELADLQMWFGVYSDFNTTANRRNFISASGAPVDPVTAAAALGTPIVLMSGATSSWHTNDGSGGGYTLTGALTDGTVPLPVDAAVGMVFPPPMRRFQHMLVR